MISDLEKKLNSHIIFLYNNPKLNDAMIDEEFVYAIYDELDKLNRYNSLLVVIHTRGGNLKSGTMLARYIKNKYKEVAFYVPERCGSTGTYLLLMCDKLYKSDKAIITPCEPQMTTVDGNSISSSVIRNYLENVKISNLNPIDVGKYYATINYFKDISKTIYNNNSEEVINYMLRRVNNHEYPLTFEDLECMKINIVNMDGVIKNSIDMIHDNIKKVFASDMFSNTYNIIIDVNNFLVYKRIFDIKKNKIFEGYINNDTISFKKKLKKLEKERENEKEK